MDKKKHYNKVINYFSHIILAIIPIIVFLVIFNQYNDFFTNVKALNIVNIQQEIRSINPINYEFTIEVSNNTKNNSEITNFELIKEEKVDDNIEQVNDNVVEGSIFNFQGIADPFSYILLEINSDPFVVTVESDALGHWFWTNFGHPLELGQHSINLFEIDKTFKEGDNKINIKQYSFNISGLGSDIPVDLVIDDSRQIYDENISNIEEAFLASDKSLYIFSNKLANANIDNIYNTNEIIEVEYNLIATKKEAEVEADIIQELFFVNDKTATTSLVATFSDQVDLKDNIKLTKKYKIDDEIIEGAYLLKTSANIGTELYIQNLLFEIEQPQFVTFSGLAVVDHNVNSILVWNIIFLLIIIIIVLSVAIFEFRRFFIYEPIDEETLRSHHYFKKNK